MLSRFHLIAERHGRTDRRIELLYQYRASVCWRAIKMKICLAVLTEYRCVTDGQTDVQTDGQTSCDGIVRAMHTRRAAKRMTIQTGNLSQLSSVVIDTLVTYRQQRSSRVTEGCITSLLVRLVCSCVYLFHNVNTWDINDAVHLTRLYCTYLRDFCSGGLLFLQ